MSTNPKLLRTTTLWREVKMFDIKQKFADLIKEKAEELKDSFGKTVTITAEQNFMRVLVVKTPFPEKFLF